MEVSPVIQLGKLMFVGISKFWKTESGEFALAEIRFIQLDGQPYKGHLAWPTQFPDSFSLQ